MDSLAENTHSQDTRPGEFFFRFPRLSSWLSLCLSIANIKIPPPDCPQGDCHQLLTNDQELSDGRVLSHSQADLANSGVARYFRFALVPLAVMESRSPRDVPAARIPARA